MQNNAIVLLIEDTESTAHHGQALIFTLEPFADGDSGQNDVSTYFFSDSVREGIIGADPLKVEIDLTLQAKEHDSALFDAMGDVMDAVTNRIYHDDEGEPETVTFVIATNGVDTASQRHNIESIAEMVYTRRLLGWRFIVVSTSRYALETADVLDIGSVVDIS